MPDTDICAVMLSPKDRCPNPSASYGVCEEHKMYALNYGGKLGFNLIVKNEEKHLAKCLKSIREVADEIVVTDTGSEDSTIEIAFEYADKVLFHKWQDSFSEARNFSLQFSTADWIGWIDADETLMPEGRAQLENVLRGTTDAVTLFCPLLSELADGRSSKHYLPKFFKRGTAHFEAIVHNQLIHGQPILQTDISFWHTGYNLDEETMARKRARTAGLLRKQLEKEPDDAFATMNLARTLLTSSNYVESLEIVERGLKLKDMTIACRQMLYYNQAICAVNLEDLEKGEQACWDCLAINPDNIDMTFILGWIACLKSKWPQAIIYFNRYFQLREEQSKDGFNLLILDFWDAFPQAWGFLGETYRAMGMHGKSIDCITEILKSNPNDLKMWKNLAVAYQAAGKENMIVRVLNEVIGRGLADAEILAELAKFG